MATQNNPEKSRIPADSYAHEIFEAEAARKKAARARRFAGWTLAGVSLATIAAVEINEELHREPFYDQVVQEIKSDGFEATVYKDDLDTIDLKIGATCVVRGVEITIEQKGNDIYDVSSYTLPVHSKPGADPSITFADHTEFESQVVPQDGLCVEPEVFKTSQ